MIRSVFVALTAASLLSGCSAISALSGAATPLDAYDLSAPANPVSATRPTSRQLVIELPNVPGALTSERILIRPQPLQAAYLPDAQWSVEVPIMVQTLMVRAFEDSNAFRYVGRQPLGAIGDYALVSELTDFQAEVGPDRKTTTIRMRMTARLVREDDAAILSTRTFSTSALVGSTETLALVQGFNQAGQELLTDLTGWVLKTLNIGIRRGS